jgi:hypothetical protein
MGERLVGPVAGPEADVATSAGLRTPVAPASGVALGCAAAIRLATGSGQNEPSVGCAGGPAVAIMSASSVSPGRCAGAFLKHVWMTCRR